MKEASFNNKGFTIVEFIIVSVIIAIITAALIRTFSETSITALDMAAKKVANDLSFARMRAMTTSRPHKIYINTPDRLRVGFANYTLIKNPDDQKNFDLNISQKYPSVSFFKNYSVKFNGLGINVYKSMSSIVLLSGSKSKSIKIISETGNIYVQ